MDLFGDLPAPNVKNKSAGSAIKDPNPTPPTSSPIPQVLHTPGASVGLKRKAEENSLDGMKKICRGHRLHGYHAERKGEREEMQDAHVIMDDFTSEVKDLHESIHRLAYYAVFDGHGGARMSKYAAKHLHTILAQKFPKGDLSQVEKEIKKCLIDSFKLLDEDFLRLASKQKPSWKDGSTAVAILVINDTLYIANLGDSKALLCRYNETSKKHLAIPLTKDHDPTLYEERMRIQKSGGQVRDGRVMGVLEVSRSLGDGPYKNHGVICIPDVKRCQLTHNDRFLVIACDGLWKQFNSEESVEFVNQILDEPAKEHSDRKGATEFRYETACSRLSNEAVRRLSADNVTVLLVSIDELA